MNLEQIGSFRLTTLLLVMNKIFVSIIVNQTYLSYNNIGLVSNCQYGFTKDFSIEDAFLNFKNSIKYLERKYIVSIFMNIVGAFDNITIKTRIISSWCSSNIVKFINSYFHKKIL